MEKILLELGIKLYMLISMIVGAMLSASIIKDNPSVRLLHSIGGGGLALFAVPALAELSGVKSTQIISFMTVMITIFGMSIILFIKKNIETIFTKIMNKWIK
jgi:hypothetical protein